MKKDRSFLAMANNSLDESTMSCVGPQLPAAAGNRDLIKCFPPLWTKAITLQIV